MGFVDPEDLDNLRWLEREGHWIPAEAERLVENHFSNVLFDTIAELERTKDRETDIRVASLSQFWTLLHMLCGGVGATSMRPNASAASTDSRVTRRSGTTS